MKLSKQNRIRLKFTISLIHWLTYKPVFKNYYFDGAEFSYTVFFRARWYSPLFIIYALFLLFASVFTSGILEWIDWVYDELTTDGEHQQRSWSGEFKPDVPMIERRLLLFRAINEPSFIF